MTMSLTKMELRWGRAAFEAIFPGWEDGGLVSVKEMDVEAFMTDLVAAIPFRAALGFRAAIWLVALAPLFLLRRFATIVSLGQAEREGMIARLYASPTYVVRQLVLILKAMGALLYAGAPIVRERMQRARSAVSSKTPGLVSLRVKRSAAA